MKTTRIFLTTVFLINLFSFLNTNAQSDPSWATKQELGFNLNARADAGMVSIGNDLYILGGYDGCGPKNFIKYNILTAEITQLQNLGVGCANPISDGVLFTQGNKIYSFHGNGTNIYDTITNEWTNYPTAAGLNPDTGFMIDNDIYITSKSGNVFYAFNTVTNTFTQKADYLGLPNRRGAMSFDIAGKGYIAGGTLAGTNGCTTEAGCFSNNVYEYNPVTDTWSTKAGMPKSIVFGSAISHNGKGYAGLGDTYQSTIGQRVRTALWYEYNPLNDSWITKENYLSLPLNDYYNSVSETSIAKINDEIFIFGGVSDGGSRNYKDNITKYNVTSNTWTVLNADPGKNRTEAAGFYLDGKIYIGGGHDSEGLNDFWEYSIATNEWNQKTNLPTNHTQRACVELNGKGYFVGGYGKGISGNNTNNPNANYLETLTEYDPAENTFTEKTPYPVKRSGMVALTYDGNIYAGFGNGFTGSPTNIFYMYNPQTNTWTAKASAPFTGANLSSFVIGNIGYVITFSPVPIIGKYNFLTDSWTTVSHSLTNFNSPEYSNQAFVFNGDAYIVHGDYNDFDRISKFNPINDTWTLFSNIPFKSEGGNSIIYSPNEIYFGFGVGGVSSNLGVYNSNSWSALKFGSNVSDKVGLYETKYSNLFTSNCNFGSLTDGAKYTLADENGDLFIAVESNTTLLGGVCMEVSSVELTTPFQTAAANYGNGFQENAMFLNKNLLLKDNNAIGSGGIVRLYFTEVELQKLVTDFNIAYNLNKTISDIKIVRYLGGELDHDISNNTNPNGFYTILTSTINNYGTDYYLEIDCSGNNTITGEVRAALFTGQNLGIEITKISKITLYPNPTNSILNIEMEQKIEAMNIVDMSGRSTAFKTLSGNSFDVSALANGVYFIEITTVDGQFRKKFIKN